MGLFNRIISRAAGEAVGKVLGDAINNAISGNGQNNGTDGQEPTANGSGVQSGSSNVQQPDLSPDRQTVQQLPEPKQSVKRSYQLWLSDERGDYNAEASFMLSGDFVESKTNAGEIDVVYIYDPLCSDAYTGFKLNEARPYFMIAPDIDEVFCSVGEYCENKTVKNAIWVQPSQEGKMMFRAKFEYYGDFMVMYGFRRTDGSPGGLCLVYKKDIEGTQLLGRLFSELEEAALTYNETITDKD